MLVNLSVMDSHVMPLTSGGVGHGTNIYAGEMKNPDGA